MSRNTQIYSSYEEPGKSKFVWEKNHRGHKMTAYWGCLIKTLKQLLQKHSKK